MTYNDLMTQLEKLGKPQTVKTYRRHGAGDNVYGISFVDFGKLRKKIKVDHELALQLWDSGNFDARNLAAMIADPEKLTAKVLGAWVKCVQDHGLSFSLSTIAARSPAGRKLMPKWMEAKGEWPAATGVRM